MTRQVPVKNGGLTLVALVDDIDYSKVSAYSWSLMSKGYANATGGILMHRLVLDAVKGQRVDHEDRNKLNNVRSNLRFCTQSQNIANSPKRGNSLYKGVRFFKRDGNWQARITVNGTEKHLGYFPTAELAALAYNAEAKEKWGKFALLNEVPDASNEAY